jgi:hypothetical protein
MSEMNDQSDPATHQNYERQFFAHVLGLLGDDRLRIDTTRGRRPVTSLMPDVRQADQALLLKRTMSEMGKPDREMEAKMPVGKSVDITVSRRTFWLFKSAVGNLRVVCISPVRALIAGENPRPMSASDVTKALSEIPPGIRVPQTVVLMSTSGFTTEAKLAAERGKDRTVVLVAPNPAGGWVIAGPPPTKAMSDLFDPEAEAVKRRRIQDEIESARVDLLSSGLAADQIAAKTNLPMQLVEGELKSYAKMNPGLAAKRLDGRLVVFRDGASTGPVSDGGMNMPFIDKMRSLFSMKGEIEKKISLLSERRAALSQQRDRSYEDMSVLEAKETELRRQFKEAGGDLAKRRITTQLLQMRKDQERRQQLLSMLNQQINIIGTHLTNLELQQQGKNAKLPTSDEIAGGAAEVENLLKELEESGDLASSVSSAGQSGLCAEEQALYDELSGQANAEKVMAEPETEKPASAPATPAAPAAQKLPPIPQRKRSEPEAG